MKALRITLITILFFTGLGAIWGGYTLMLDPTGGDLGLSVDILGDSPFRDFLVPGIVLFSVNGIGSLAGGILGMIQNRLFPPAGMALGIFLMAWIVIQAGWIGLHWLHILYGSIGLVEFLLALVLQRNSRAG